MKKEYIKRESYLKKIVPTIGNDLIKILVGQRRVGKSYMLLQIIDLIASKDKKANIIYVNKELDEYDKIQNHTDLVRHVEQNTKKTKNNYVLIDEIQEISDFHKAIRSLRAKGNHDIYCTGSNAKMISAEIATLLSGRYLEIQIFPLSYTEFLKFHTLTETNDSLEKYLHFGGLPYLKHLQLTDDIVFPHLDAIYNTILFKDIAERHNIRNFHFLEKLVEYLAKQTGSVISGNKIGEFLRTQKISISSTAVLEYLHYLIQAFFIHKVSRLNLIGKKIFEIHEKYYFSDLGLRHTVHPFVQTDFGRILENAVYLHLLSLGYTVYVGVLGGNEIDFVAKKSNEQIYIQVAYQVHEENQKREFGNLLKVKDNYPKLVVSTDTLIGKNTIEGIRHMHIRDFLGSHVISLEKKIDSYIIG